MGVQYLPQYHHLVRWHRQSATTIIRRREHRVGTTYEIMLINCTGLIWNFLKMEKEHITNQNLFKTVMDYKFPFDSNRTPKREDTNENGDTHSSISTFKLKTEIEIQPNS